MKPFYRRHLRKIVAAVAVVAVGAGVGGYKAATGCACATPNFAATAAIFIAQTAAGGDTGGNCANAHSAAWFNTSGNWSSTASAGKISPGAAGIAGLCGTITSTLTAQASGSAGNPITIVWQPGAKLSQPVCSASTGCFNTNSKTDLILDGSTNGVIENTANGTGLANQSATDGIKATACTRCEIKNLAINNMYVHSGLGSEVGNSSENCITASGDGWSIHDNTMHDASWCIYTSDVCNDTIRIYSNNIYNVDHGFALGQNGVACAAATVYFYGNHVHDTANWDSTAHSYHHDGLHCYTSGTAGVAAHYTGFYVYNNLFDGANGTDFTSWVFLEGGTGGGATPCADSTSPMYVFNNVGVTQTNSTNGILEPTSGIPNVYNNTMIGTGITAGIAFVSGSVATSGFYKNNVVTTAQRLADTTSAALSGGVDYNLYANGAASNTFHCDATFTAVFATWQACISGDSHSSLVADAKLGSDGTPQAGSGAIGTGTNLTSLCTGGLAPLCSDKNGAARPTVGAWDMGAINH